MHITSRTRRISATAIGALAALALTSCGSDSGSTGGDTTPPADVDLTVGAGPGIKFDQTAYTVAAGDVTIAYDNLDAQRHTLDVIDASKTVIGKELVVGKSGDVDTGTYTLAAGEYSLECLVPGHDAMRATLTVTE